MGKEKKRLEDFISDEKFQDWVLHKKYDEYWTGWQLDNPGNEALINDAKASIQSVTIENTESLSELIDASWENLRRVIIGKEEPIGSPNFSLNVWLKYAAAISIILIATVAFFKYDNSFSQTVTHETSFGEKKNIRLSDGTKVTINANSALEVFTNWRGETSRNVELTKGEAFFDVTKRPTAKRPEFKVNSGELEIVVLGTKFNVKNRRSKVEVALMEGKVELRSNEQTSATMSPGDIITYSQKTGVILNQYEKTNKYAWMDNKLVFNESSLEDIAIIIEDFYGKSVEIQNANLLTRKLSGEIPNDNLEILLQVIESSLGVEIDILNDHITIKSIK